MRNRKSTTLALLAVLFGTAALFVAPLGAQQPGFKRAMLQDVELSVEGRHFVMATAEFDSGVSVGRHTHPGEEVSYVLEGTFELMVEGKPAVTLKAGDFFSIPAGVVHDAKNVGTGKGRVLANYVVKKGEPVSSPAK